MGDLVLCAFIHKTADQKAEIKKKASFADNTKFKTVQADLSCTNQDAGMMFTIDGETFFKFIKNIWIGDLGASYHIPNDDSGLFDVTNINELIHGSSG